MTDDNTPNLRPWAVVRRSLPQGLKYALVALGTTAVVIGGIAIYHTVHRPADPGVRALAEIGNGTRYPPQGS